VTLGLVMRCHPLPSKHIGLGRDDPQCVSDDTEVGDLEKRGVVMFVDRDDALCVPYRDDVPNRPARCRKAHRPRASRSLPVCPISMLNGTQPASTTGREGPTAGLPIVSATASGTAKLRALQPEPGGYDHPRSL
jgi:hypothetical protein